MKIKKCPFCPGEGKIVNTPPTNSIQSDEYRVECCDCGAAGRSCDEKDAAVTFWNNRPTSGAADCEACPAGRHEYYELLLSYIFCPYCGQRLRSR